MFREPFYKTSQLQPPGWAFSGAWLLIYPLIGVSGIFLANEQPDLLILWFIQLILNLTWVPILFTSKNLYLSFFHLILLFVILCILFYLAIPKVKALLLPYILWLFFATIIFYDTLLINQN